MKRLLLIFACASVLAACAKTRPPNKWDRPDIVCIRLSGEQAMIVREPAWGGYSWGYRVRLGKAEQTSSGLLGPTVRTDRSYATLVFREFELQDCDEIREDSSDA